MNNTMTKEELAALLNGREYRNEITQQEATQAKNAGLLVIFGASDDLIEFYGAFTDEGDCYNGGKFKIHRKGFLGSHEGCECEYCGYKAVAEKCADLEAEWCGHRGADGYSWTYKTALRYAAFDIMDDGEKYCRGIVITAADLPEITPTP